MKQLCVNCDAIIAYVVGDEQYASCAVRCRCGTRYRIYGGRIDKVVLDEINIANVDEIDKDKTLRPAEKQARLTRLANRAKARRNSNDVVYSKIIVEAERSAKRWFKVMNEQTADSYKKIEIPTVGKIILMAVNVKGLMVNGEPWDVSRMKDEEYIEATSLALGADMGTL